MNIRLVGNELFDADGRTDGRTDRMKDVTRLSVDILVSAYAFKNRSVKYKWLDPMLSTVTFSLGTNHLNVYVPVPFGVR